MSEQVFIFDTTLRDGEQSPGASMTADEKLSVARALSRLGVDVIEAGFPAASPDDFFAVQRIATEVGSGSEAPQVCGLARASKPDIEQAWRAVSAATRPRIHTFLATSPIHREAKLRMSQAEVLTRIRDMVGYARSLCEDIEFSPEDAGRTEPDFLRQAVQVAIEAGASIINLPDTVGYTQPKEYGAMVAMVREQVPGASTVTLSVHCHDDLGLAVANALAGLQAGARQAEVTINGVGERAGNTALEEVVMALELRPDIYGLSHGIRTSELWNTSRLVREVTGMEVQPNKAVVGRNAFAHEAGIHQDGMLKSQATYEIMRPETVGAPQSELVMGKHSGRRALDARLKELGFELDEETLDATFVRFKALADRRKHVSDSDLIALMKDEAEQAHEDFVLEFLQVTCGTDGISTATVTLRGPDEQQHTLAAVGTGPVDGVFNAIDGILQTRSVLLDYQLRATGEGKDALGEARVKVQSPEGKSFRGFGSDQDVIVASGKAYLSAVSKCLARGPSNSVQLETVAALEESAS